ncbi:MAG: CvpA family protein [Phycisphaerae bacterium]|nr:CvpA family protein [Phycisphaerae bacterium]
MIVYALAVIMILGFAYLQMMQGLFSSIIMAVCSVFSLAAAAALYPWLAGVTNLYTLQPSIADAVSFSLVFVAVLLGLRCLADKFIKGDIYFDVIVDRAGGAVFGLFSATVMVGVLLLVLQLAPFGRVIWGNFSPYSDSLRRDQRIVPFFADEFVVGFSELISAGSMSASEKLTDQHDDLLLEAFCARNTAGHKGKTDVAAGALKSVELFDAAPWAGAMEKTDTPIPSNPVLGEHEPTKVVVVRAEVNVSATDEPTPHWWRLPATHFRLLCVESTGGVKQHRSFYPVGYVYYDLDAKAFKVVAAPEGADNRPEPAKLILERPKESGVYGDDKYGQGKIAQDKINLVMDWIYVLPRNADPEALYFRRVEAVKTPKISGKFTPAALREKMLTTPTEEEKKARQGKRR